MDELIVTGFGPFPGVPDNPSAAVVRALAALERPPAMRATGGGTMPGPLKNRPRVRPLTLETTWQAADRLAVPPRATVVMFGVAAGARRIRYEGLAHGEDRPLPDANGAYPGGGSVTRYTALPVARLVAEAVRSGFPVSHSRSPGRYVCNASYRSVLARIPRSLFVHIPMPAPRGPMSLAGLIAHAAWLIETLRALPPCGRC